MRAWQMILIFVVSPLVGFLIGWLFMVWANHA